MHLYFSVLIMGSRPTLCETGSPVCEVLAESGFLCKDRGFPEQGLNRIARLIINRLVPL